VGHIVRRSKPEACHLKPFREKGGSADQEIHRPHPGHGLPWQKGANTYIAGHCLGYEGTSSYPIFYYLDQLVEGDKILLEDSAGATYTYRVTDQMIVDPDNVEVMEPVDGKSLVSLRTCTLPDYEQRLIVQGELVDKST
jgi:sortase A